LRLAISDLLFDYIFPAALQGSCSATPGI